ncbi:ComEA family DNA-binding protein [Chitinophaga niabensis]|nr:helix-hairpin-helix domain-containing protein [Chitinophaga niabensis]
MLLLVCNWTYAQEEGPMQHPGQQEHAQLEEQALLEEQEQTLLEQQAQTGNGNEEQSLPENDEQTQQRESYARRKLNLNTADAAALESLGLLHALQIEQFLLYRRSLGPLISIYELQAVPGFNLPLIRTLLPYVWAGNGLEPCYTWKDYVLRGKHTLLLRYTYPFQSAGKYNGSPDKMMLRYRYQFSRYASWGLVMEKDAGEGLFAGKQKSGFDHYGIHLFFRNIGRIKALALGDYTVNMGQGLIQWHGLAFGKSSAVMHTKREGDVLRPYASAGEFFFYRGAGITCQTGPFTFTAFISGRKLDARAGEVPGSAGTLVSTGYHRTDAESALKGNITQSSVGAVLKWSAEKGHIAWNMIGHQFSKPLSKGDKAYQLFAATGNHWLNTSIDHAFNWRNLHFFGEAAISKQGKTAILQGAMITLAHNVDMGILYRKEGIAYETLYGNTFSENPTPGNESGLYTAISLRWGAKWELSAYADVFRFPWLKYRINNPSEGYDVLMSITWRPDKTTELNAQFRHDDKPFMQRQQLRAQWSMKITGEVIWRSKVQVSKTKTSPTSFLAHHQCQARWKHWRFTAGYTWFDTAETEGLYLTGQQFPGDNSLSRFSGKGFSTRLAIQFHKIWCHWVRAVTKEVNTAVMLQYQL